MVFPGVPHEKAPYPQEFVDAVRAVFPDGYIHHYIEANSDVVEEYLRKGTPNLSAETIMTMIEKGQIEELKAMAEKAIQCEKLHAWWRKLR